jgi:HAD superfamily hydrolase (TIGR01509 family)
LIPHDLVSGVDVLCLDAGNTVIFLDHARLATALRERANLEVTADVVRTREGEAKRLVEKNALYDCDWKYRDRPGGIGWGRMVGTIARHCGLLPKGVPDFLAAAWELHVEKNFWCLVPDGLGVALDEMRKTGAKTVIVSNSEGMLEKLFRELGILGHFDAVVDSGIVGVEKPDPRIFDIALERTGGTKERALHLGDVYAGDIVGARAAGIRCALIDPFEVYEGLHRNVARVPGAPEVARAITAARTNAGTNQ